MYSDHYCARCVAMALFMFLELWTDLCGHSGSLLQVKDGGKTNYLCFWIPELHDNKLASHQNDVVSSCETKWFLKICNSSNFTCIIWSCPVFCFFKPIKCLSNEQQISNLFNYSHGKSLCDSTVHGVWQSLWDNTCLSPTL